ncbi:hypothetical protein TELCIR_13551, partial [Teladorsagia circumcincta]
VQETINFNGMNDTVKTEAGEESKKFQKQSVQETINFNGMNDTVKTEAGEGNIGEAAKSFNFIKGYVGTVPEGAALIQKSIGSDSTQAGKPSCLTSAEIYGGFGGSPFVNSTATTNTTCVAADNVPVTCQNGNACVDAQQMDIYRDLILRHLIQDISTTCAKLGLPTDAQNWTQEHGSRWISEMCQQFSLTPPRQTYLSGRVLLSMTQKDFVALAPEGGDTLYAQLQLWKTGQTQQYATRACLINRASPQKLLRYS